MPTFNENITNSPLIAESVTSFTGNSNFLNITNNSSAPASNITNINPSLDYPAYDFNSADYATRLGSTKFYPMEKIIYGYLFFPAAVIVLVINSLMLLVFFKGKFFTPANVLISAIAVTDILTCVTPTPFFFYFYSLGHADEFTPFNMCMAYDLLCRKIPRTFHTVSAWLTFGLAVQRFIVVSFPLKAKIFCNMKFSVVWICMSYFLACTLHGIVFVFDDYIPLDVPSAINSNLTVQGCYVVPREYFYNSQDVIINAYNTVNGVFVHLAPCVLLVVLDIILIVKLRRAEKWRAETSDQKQPNKNSFIMNIIIIWIVAAFLIVETPIAVGYLFQVTYTSLVAPPYGKPIENLTRAVTIMNYLIVLTSISNTVVYCCLSKRFRSHLCRIMRIDKCCGKENK